MSTTHKLPAIKDLVTDLEEYKKMDELNVLLNQEPPKSWLKKHPTIKKQIVNAEGKKVTVPYEYLPIDKVEYLLKRIFKYYKIEVLNVLQLFNGVSVTVRVHYKDLLTNEWRFHDGVGASQLQTKSGKSAADMANINHGAVSMAVPMAKTLAIKDACDMFGKLFGADVNRQDTKDVVIDLSLKSNDEKLEEIKTLFEIEGLTLPEEERMNIERIIQQKEVESYDKAIKVLKHHLPKKQ